MHNKELVSQSVFLDRIGSGGIAQQLRLVMPLHGLLQKRRSLRTFGNVENGFPILP